MKANITLILLWILTCIAVPILVIILKSIYPVTLFVIPFFVTILDIVLKD